MTDQQQHPITLPDELVKQWAHMLEQHTDAEVFNRIARWGADQELKACCEWIKSYAKLPVTADSLRAARCPKPPSLKAQALAALAAADGADHPVVATVITADQHAIIRRALEALPE